MIRTTLACLILAAVPAAAQSTANDAEPLAECEVLARINSQVILACDLAWQVELMIQQNLGEGASENHSPELEKIRRQQLQLLTLRQIDIALLYSDFRSNAPGADMNAIYDSLAKGFEEREVPRLMKMMGVESREELQKRLMAVGTSLDERRQDFYKTMIARSWLNQSIEYDKEVTHEQMLAYYQDHLPEYDQPNRVRWEELMVSSANHPSEREAYAALARLGNRAHLAASRAGVGQPAFETLARAESDGFTADRGGQHNWTTQGALAAEQVDEALFHLEPGEMSPILRGPAGFHIVRVLERKKAGIKPFSEVQAAIRKGLHGERFDAAVEAKFDELKRGARIWTAFHGDLSYERLAELQGGGVKR